MLLADWIEYRKTLMFSMGILFIVWMALMWLAHINNFQDSALQGPFFVFVGFVTLFKFCELAGRKMHRSKGLFLTLPASNEEKYVTLLLEGVIYFLSFQLIFWVGVFLWKLFGSDISFLNFTDKLNLEGGGISGIAFISSLFFLSYMSFSKHPFLIVIGGQAVYCFLFSYIAVHVVGNLIDSSWPSSNIYDIGKFFGSLLRPIAWVATLVVMYVAYLKLKEKEQR
jgi:hypothetical protein